MLFRSTSTVIIYQRHQRRYPRPLEIANIRQGPELALILQLFAADGPGGRLDEAFVRNALAPKSRSLLQPRRIAPAGVATLALLVVFVAVGLAHRNTLPPISYAPDDPIAPGGQRRSHAEIAAFMEHEVMPFARRIIGPLKGGPDKIDCNTCHGADAPIRNWKMPGVRALPEPDVRLAGMEQFGFALDPQMRNAVYGYLAREENQHKAGYMRGLVVPGMAALLHRPPYDFTKSYGYNRSRNALGCYHCHLVEGT